jgi:hypothetical protein
LKRAAVDSGNTLHLQVEYRDDNTYELHANLKPVREGIPPTSIQAQFAGDPSESCEQNVRPITGLLEQRRFMTEDPQLPAGLVVEIPAERPTSWTNGSDLGYRVGIPLFLAFDLVLSPFYIPFMF